MKLEPDQDGSFTCPDDPGEPTTSVARVSVTPQECEILAELARDQHVLEIGTGLGISTMAMEKTATSLVTIDPDPWVHEHIWPNLCPQTLPVRDKNTIADARFDMVFIDGDHQPDALRADLTFAYAHLAPGAMIVCHDARYTHVWTELCKRGEWEYRATAHGLAIQVTP